MICSTMTNFDPSKLSYTLVEKIPNAEVGSFEYVIGWISLYTGLHFPPAKHMILYRRLINLCFKQGFADLNELANHLKLKDMPDLPSEVARVTSTNHSFFFREPDVLDFFRKKVVPTLPEGNNWRIWSAASAAGEEAYTLAMILSEMIGINQALSQTAILGTDISYPMITQAEHGVYHKQKLEMVGDVLLNRYFHQVNNDQWSILPAIKPMCTFRRMNLNSYPWPFQNQFHVVFCRNILYYFDRPLQQELVERIYDITLPGGWLITSVTETLYWAKTRWHTVTTGVYRKI
jgi:chemotaxis protein methyltransferase CheR